MEKPIAVQVWEALGRFIAKEDNPYLSPNKFVLQKDAFIRLSDEDVESDVPFVTYDFTEVTSDEGLGFSMVMLQEGAAFLLGDTTFTATYKALAHGGQVATMNNKQYDELGENPEKSAESILLTIKLLLAGQVAMGCSWNNGHLNVCEVFLLGFEKRPLPISIVGNFGWFGRKSYDYTVKQNHVLAERLTIPNDFIWLPPIVSGKRVTPGRKVDSIASLEPLDKKAFEALESASVFHQTVGKNAEENIWKFLYKRFEFWATTAAVAGFMIFLHTARVTPRFFHTAPIQLYAFASWGIITFISLVWIGRRTK